MNFFLLGAAVLLILAVGLFVWMRTRVARTEGWIRGTAEIVDIAYDGEGGGRPLFAYDAPDGSRRLWQSKLSKSGPGLRPKIGTLTEVRIDPLDFNRVTVRGWDGGNFALVLVSLLCLLFGVGLVVAGAVS